MTRVFDLRDAADTIQRSCDRGSLSDKLALRLRQHADAIERIEREMRQGRYLRATSVQVREWAKALKGAE